MPVKLRTWGVIIGVIAVVLIVLSLLFFTQQVQDAPIPTPTGPVPVVTAEVMSEATPSDDDTEAESTEAPDVESTAES